MSEELQKGLEGNGIRIILGKPAGAILGADKVQGCIGGRRRGPCRHSRQRCRSQTKRRAGQKSGIVIGETGGIKTNIRKCGQAQKMFMLLETVLRQLIMLLTGRLFLCLGQRLSERVRVAGINAAGGYSIFPGTLFSVGLQNVRLRGRGNRSNRILGL